MRQRKDINETNVAAIEIVIIFQLHRFIMALFWPPLIVSLLFSGYAHTTHTTHNTHIHTKALQRKYFRTSLSCTISTSTTKWLLREMLTSTTHCWRLTNATRRSIKISSITGKNRTTVCSVGLFTCLLDNLSTLAVFSKGQTATTIQNTRCDVCFSKFDWFLP